MLSLIFGLLLAAPSVAQQGNSSLRQRVDDLEVLVRELRSGRPTTTSYETKRGSITFAVPESGIQWQDGTVSTTAVNSISGLGGVVQTAKIDTDAVTAAKILAGSVQTSKMGTDAVLAASISAGAVETAKVAADAITSTAIRSASVQTSKLVDGAVTAQKVNDAAIQTAKLANDSVSNAKILADDSSLPKMTSGRMRYISATDVWTSAGSSASNGSSQLCLGGSVCNGNYVSTLGVSLNCKGTGSTCLGFNNQAGAVGGDYYSSALGGTGHNASGFYAGCVAGLNCTNGSTAGIVIGGELINLAGGSYNTGLGGYGNSVPSGQGGLGTIDDATVGGRRARGRQSRTFTWNLTANDVYKDSYGTNWYTLHADANGGLAIEVNNTTTTFSNGNMVVPGSSTASSFWGDGAHLTGIVATALAAGSVETAKLATDSVIAAKIISGAVETSKLADGAVTAQKIADSAVQTAKLAQWSVDTSKIRPTGNEGQVLTQKNGAAVWDAPSASGGSTGNYTFTGSTIAANGTVTITTAATAALATKNFFMFNDGKVRFNAWGPLSPPVDFDNFSTVHLSEANNKQRTPFAVSFSTNNNAGLVAQSAFYFSTNGNPAVTLYASQTGNNGALGGGTYETRVGSGTLSAPVVAGGASLNNLALWTGRTLFYDGVANADRVLGSMTIQFDSSGSSAALSSFPTNIVFSNTSPNASAQSEKMRLTSTGTALIGLTSQPSGITAGGLSVGASGSTVAVFSGYSNYGGNSATGGSIIIGRTQNDQLALDHDHLTSDSHIDSTYDSVGADLFLGVRTSNTSGAAITKALGVLGYGIVVSSSPIPSVACNAGTPVIAAESTNNHGEFVAGVAAANCTVTFSGTWPKKPKCWCNDESNILVIQAITTTTTLKCTAATTLGGDTITYGCQGAP